MSEKKPIDRTSMIMRDFLYLDTDYLESYLAQAYRGLEIEETIEILNQHTSTKNAPVVTGAMEGAVDLVKAIKKIVDVQGKFSISVDFACTDKSDTDSTRNVVTRKLRDYMFDVFSRHVGSFVKEKRQMRVGDYIEFSTTYGYFDLDRIEKLHAEEYRLTLSSRKADNTEFSYEKFEEVRQKLAFLKTMIPFDAFLYADDLLVVLKEEYLREKRHHIGFKFNGLVKVVGRIDKEIPREDVSTSPIIKRLNDIQLTSLQMLKDLGFIANAEAKIITPIAVYRETGA